MYAQMEWACHGLTCGRCLYRLFNSLPACKDEVKGSLGWQGFSDDHCDSQPLALVQELGMVHCVYTKVVL